MIKYFMTGTTSFKVLFIWHRKDIKYTTRVIDGALKLIVNVYGLLESFSVSLTKHQRL